MMKMKRKWMTIMTAAALAAGVVCGCANPEKSGVEALKNGEYQEAEAQFQEMTQSGSREDAGALEAFRQAVDNGVQQSVQLYNLMGVCAMQTEEYEAALEYIQSGLALAESADGEEQPSEELIREMKYNEIICYEKQSDWENARQKADEYLSEYPDDESVQREAEFLETR